MNNKKPWWKKPLSWALALSVLFHLGLLAIQFPQVVNPAKKERELITITLNDPQVNLTKIKEQILMREMEKGQVVNTEQNGRKEKPQNTRFLGKADQSFDRQTVAATVASFKEAGKGKHDGIANAKQDETTAPQKAKKAAPVLGKMSLSDLALAKADLPTNQVRKQERKEAAQGLERGKEGLSGFAANNDYVEDVALGDMTQLNTQEFKYFGFYDRIRQKLEQFWGQSLHDKAKAIYKTGRRMPAGVDSITSLKVTLDDKGNILHVEVHSTSGVREFDDAAIESFNKAGPFPNPPRGMIKDGLAEIEWGFVVKSQASQEELCALD